jgi:methyltransferase (TIGR00027 family)
MEKALEQDYREAIQRPVLVRTRFIDEHLEHAVRTGAKQIVILGAGFDSRAYRLRQLLTNTRVFEIDYGPTQEYKKRRVLEVLGGIPSNLVYAPIDFTKEKLGDVLRAAGYRPAEKTFFIWEGVSMYLPEEAVRATLLFVSSHSVPGSSIVFDFLSKSFVDSLNQAQEERARSDAQTVSRQIAGRVSAAGEPWIFGLPDDGEHEFLRGAGLKATRLLATRSAEATKQYATRRDGSTIKIPPHTGRPYYWLTEAVVPGRGGR